jgi:hypothetical protein
MHERNEKWCLIGHFLKKKLTNGNERERKDTDKKEKK